MNRAGRWWLALLVLVLVTLGLIVMPSNRAVAAPGALRLSLTQDSTESRVGTALMLTATILTDDGDGGGTPVPGVWAVEFSGTGDGGWRSGPIPTFDGQVSYRRTAPVRQQETITATLVTAGCSAVVSNAVTHQWWVPQLRLTPIDGADTAVNGSASLAVDLTHEGTGIQGTVIVDVDVTGYTRIPAPASHHFEVTTDERGHGVTDRWPGNQTTMELVTAREDTPISPARAWTTHRFGGVGGFAHPELNVKSVSVRAGTTVRAEAQFGRAEFIASNSPIIWSDPPSAWGTTDSLGHTVHDYTRTSAAAWAIAVYSPTEGMEGTAAVWWVPTITLSAPNATSVPGEPFRQTAVLSHDGLPVAGATLRFTVDSEGGDDPAPRDVVTDANGVASFTWTRNQPGNDTVTVDEFTAGVAVAPRVTTTHTWATAPPTPVDLTARQTGGSGRAGTPVEIAAHVSLDRDALTGVPVTFSDDLGNRLGGGTTGAGGDVTISYANRRVGTERITVRAAVDECQVPAQTLDVDRWVPTLELQPTNGTSTAGEAASMVATLKHGDDVVAGETIDFVSHSTSCELTDLTPSAVTDVRGEARVPLTRDVPSVDTVTAIDRTDAIPAAPRATTHTWGKRPDPPLAVSLAGTPSDGRVGTDTTVRARVTDAGRAVAGARVTIVGLSADPVRMPPTDGDGRTSHTYRRNAAQTDTIVATATLGCESSNPAEKRHEWWVPVLQLIPREATTTTGTSAHATAVLSHGRVKVSGAEIGFTISGTGQPTLERPNIRTDEEGRAELRWTRDQPGTDTVTAREVAAVQPATDTSRQIWTTPPDTRRLVVEASPERSTGRVGEDFAVEATTRFGGRNTAGILVRLHATMAGAADIDLAKDSGSVGRATFHYRRDIPGTEVVTITASHEGRTAQRTLTRTWTSPAPPKLDLSASPLDGSTRVGSNAHLNAHVALGLQAAANVSVEFTAHLPGQPDITGRGITTETGDTTFDWIRPVTGVETITVRAAVDGQTVTRTVQRTWTEEATQESTSPTASPTASPTPSASTTTPSPTSSSTTPRPPTEQPTGPPSAPITGPEVGAPGGDLQIGGSGCRPGQTVRIYLGDTRLGTTRAARDGTFSLRTGVPELPLGRYQLRSSCGKTTGDPNVDITRPQVDKGPGQIAAAGITTGSTFLFFLLVAKSVVSFLPAGRGW